MHGWLMRYVSVLMSLIGYARATVVEERVAREMDQTDRKRSMMLPLQQNYGTTNMVGQITRPMVPYVAGLSCSTLQRLPILHPASPLHLS